MLHKSNLIEPATASVMCASCGGGGGGGDDADLSGFYQRGRLLLQLSALSVCAATAIREKRANFLSR
jgi:hypothetical protein